jgi:hypothetical protein
MPEKGARDRLIRLAATHPDWVLGFEDESWFSRLAHPKPYTLHQHGVIPDYTSPFISFHYLRSPQIPATLASLPLAGTPIA